MTAPIPQTLAAKVTESLNELINQSDGFRSAESPEISSILEDIRKLQATEPAEALVRRGAIAALCADVEQLEKLYQEATANNSFVKQEFAVNFANAGAYRRAYEISAPLLDPKQGFFSSLWRRAMAFGYLAAISQGLPSARKMFKSLADEDFTLIDSASRAAKEHALSDEMIVSVFEIAGNIQRQHRMMFAGAGPRLTVVKPAEESPYIQFSIPIDLPAGEIRQMNRELAHVVAERLGGYPDGLVLTFRKSEIEKQRAAA